LAAPLFFVVELFWRFGRPENGGGLLKRLSYFCTGEKGQITFAPKAVGAIPKGGMDSMKIAIIGANGKEGKLLIQEAICRGHEVLAIVRKEKEKVHPAAKTLERDLFELSYDDLRGWSVVIDSFGVWEPEQLPLHQTSLKHLSDILSGKPNRLIVVGSAGTLFVDPLHKIRLVDSDSMPDMYKPLARAMATAFDELRKRSDVNWTYLSPPGFFDAEAPRTGQYKSGRDNLLVNAEGASTISYADAAIAIIDEAEKPRHIKERFTIAGA
jgi:putative NADH-flavin reductase